jgi:hypothetical protein
LLRAKAASMKRLLVFVGFLTTPCSIQKIEQGVFFVANPVKLFIQLNFAL